MSLHPTSTHWFETYVPRDQTVYALEALAGTGEVELDKDLIGAPLLDTHELRDRVCAFECLVNRYGDLLPVCEPSHLLVTEAPETTAAEALVCLRGWLAQQLRNRRRRQTLLRRQHNLALLQECLGVMGDAAEALVAFGQPSQFLYKRILACPLDPTAVAPDDTSGLSEVYIGPAHEFHVIAGLPENRAAVDYAAALDQCESVAIPDWLTGDWARRQGRIDEEMAELTGEIAALELDAAANRDDANLANALNDMAVLRWYLDHTITLTADRRHCHVTGWTSAADPAVLQQALRHAHVDGVILFRPGPPGRPVPVRGRLPWWARPFRVFVEMLGTPGSTELDPAPLLAVIVPLLFGFMFPDVGHGLLLALGGLLFSHRHPRLLFLVPCGLTAAVFGAVFGETFGLQDPVPALWIRPLDHPLLMLLAPLAFGAAVILLGLVLSGIEARWRGEFRQWIWVDGAVLAVYLSTLIGLLWPPALAVTAGAVIWYLAGLVVTCEGGPGGCLLRGSGRLVFSTFELSLNTLSFLRVGAFALAHAALSHTLLHLVGLIEHPLLQAVALLLGHAVIILVEGLVVFVQTTRLILFEFFIRFLRAEGRLFRPVAGPAPDRPPHGGN